MIKKHNLTNKFIICVMVLATLISCKKNNVVVDNAPNNPTYAHFLSSVPSANGFYNGGVSAPRTYFVYQTNNKPTKLYVGITNVASSDRTIGMTYTSITGAVNGTHYSAPQSITVKAGSSVASIDINAKYSDYANGRMDTIKVKIDKSTMPVVFGQDSAIYYISKYCDVIPADLMGNYDNTINYANNTQTSPYSSSIIALDSTASGKATGMFSGLVYKSASGTEFILDDLEFKLDWTDESNFNIKMDEQNAFINGSNSYTAKTTLTKTSNFSSCGQTFVLYLDFVNAVTGATLYSGYQIILKR